MGSQKSTEHLIFTYLSTSQKAFPYQHIELTRIANLNQRVLNNLWRARLSCPSYDFVPCPPPQPPPPPPTSVSSTCDTLEEWERETTCWRGGGRVGEEAEEETNHTTVFYDITKILVQKAQKNSNLLKLWESFNFILLKIIVKNNTVRLIEALLVQTFIHESYKLQIMRLFVITVVPYLISSV